MSLPKIQSGVPQSVPGRFYAFYRDTSLFPGLLPLYEVGTIFREPTLCDATYKFGGFAAPHRYLIVSAGATCLDALCPSPEWGLCVWLPGRLFKVIGVHRQDDFSQVTLLEIDENQREACTTAQLSEMEAQFAEQGAQQFEAALETAALPEHANRAWLDRLAYPVGINNQGRFFESWRHRVAIGR